MATNFNAEPYFDDYDEDKKFLKILFRPGYGVQARELNQLQTILQKQVQRVGDHLFKDNSMIIPGEIGFDNSTAYVALTDTVGSTQTSAVLSSLVGQTLVGQTSGVTAKVVTYTTKTSADPHMVYVKYLTANGDTKTFVINETLIADTGGQSVVVAANANSGRAACGRSSTATIKRGVFYVRKNFVLVEEQTIVLEKFSTTPTTKVCLQVVEDIVTPEEDETLLDNASGSNNYSAPGAHRFAISLNLVKRAYTFDAAEGTDFVEILRLKNGNVEYIVDKTVYNELETTLARRTYDESGNYVIRNFAITPKEYRNNNRGSYATNRAYLANDIVAYTSSSTGAVSLYRALNNGTSDSNVTPRTSTTGASAGTVIWQENKSPPYNNGVYTASNTATVAQHLEDESKLAVGLGAGKAYVYGYEVENKTINYTPVYKARDTVNVQDTLFQPDLGQYVEVTNIDYFPDVSTYPLVNLKNQRTITLGAPSGDTIGTARIRAIDYVTGSGTGAAAKYNIYLFDIKMNVRTGADRWDFTTKVKQLHIPAGSDYPAFTADVSLQDSLGSGSVVISGTKVLGTGTSFLTEFEAGDYVKINNVYAKVTAAPTSDTEMKVSTSAVAGATNLLTVDPQGVGVINIVNNQISSTGHGFATGMEVVYDTGLVAAATYTITTDSINNTFTTNTVHGLSAGNEVRFASNFSGIVAGKTYYVLASGLTTTVFKLTTTEGGTTVFEPSPEHTTVARSVSVQNDTITVDNVGNMTVNDIIRFTGGTYFGGLAAGTVYYIKSINTVTNKITVSETSSGGTPGTLFNIIATAANVTRTYASTDTTVSLQNRIEVSSTVGMAAGNTIKFSGTAIGGISTSTEYYIKSVDHVNRRITLSLTSGGAVIALTAGTSVGTAFQSTMDDVSCSMNVELPIYSLSTSFDKTAAPIAGLTNGNSYYVNATTVNTFTLHPTQADSYAITNTVDITGTGTGTAHTFTKDATTGVKIFKPYGLLENQGRQSLIFPLPEYAIKSVADVRYRVIRTFDATVTSGLITIDASAPYQFDGTDLDNYTIVNKSTGDILTPVTEGATPAVEIPNDSSNRQIRFNVGVAYNTNKVIVQSTLFISATTPKLKTLKQHTRTITAASVGESTTIYTGKSDAVRLISVMMDSGSWVDPDGTYTVDISDRFILRTNQTDAYYGISYIELRSGKTKPSAPIKINIDFLEHSGSGDCFWVNSYAAIPYTDIPVFQGIPLRDSLDFRPRVVDNNTGAVTFTDDQSLMPKQGTTVELDYTYYLGKKCKLWINRIGQPVSTSGAATKDNYPEAPDISEAMLLYKFTVEPYTFKTNSESLPVEAVDNRRYTMADIGKLEKRINNLEYYTSLSLLESDTNNLSIRDANGLEKFKNGFIVDNFTGHGIGDTSNPDYLNSMDFDNRLLRPFYTQTQVDFVEVSSNATQRSSRGYALKGDYITLPFTEVAYVTQGTSSKTEKVNPFAFFTFLGNMTITPSNDTWFEVNRRPDLIVQSKEGNYTTISTLAEKAGVLGTIWGAWTYNWAGKTEKVISTNSYAAGTLYHATFGGGWRGGANIASNAFTTTTIATTTPKSRTGVETYVKTVYDDKVLEDKILSSTVIPYMRSRRLTVQINSLKGGSRFYPYFAGRSISQFCTPAEKIIFTPRTGKSADFDFSSRAGGNYAEAARLVDKESAELAISVGDVITGYQSNGTTLTGATAVVVGWEKYEVGVNAGKYAVYVVNRKDSVTGDYNGFDVGNVIKGSISGAEGTVVSAEKNRKGGSLVASEQGNLNFIFHVPNSDSVKFNTGTNELAVLDVSEYDKTTSGSSATKAFVASGVLQERQNQVSRTRNGEIAQRNTIDQSSDVTTETRFSNSPGWYDPLAQTFLIQETTGVFVTGVDLFFAKKDPSTSVRVEIREVVNGYPGKNILSTSKVSLPASSINVSNNASLATRFNFPSPTYLNGSTEYALIILSDSDLPEVFVAQQGQVDNETGKQIDKQPYMGVFFKSQNASTWTADQTVDLKFTLYKAKFNTTVSGTVEFENARITEETLEDDPIYFTKDSRKIRVAHQNHGMNTDSKVKIYAVPKSAIGEVYINKNATGTTTYNSVAVPNNRILTGIGTKFNTTNKMRAGAHIYREDGALIGEVSSVVSDTILILKNDALASYGTAGNTEPYSYTNPMNGVSPSEVFKTHDIDSVELDSYVITIGGSATANLTTSLDGLYTVADITSGNTSKMFVGQSLAKISGSGAFGAGAVVYEIKSASQFVATEAPAATGTLEFNYGDIPTASGSSGGEGVRASHDIPYDVINPSINIENYPGTQSNIKFQGITGKSINGSQIPYTTLSATGLPISDYIEIIPGEDHFVPVPMCFASYENAVNKNLNLSTVSTLRNSGRMLININTNNENLSPIINVNNVAITAISNKVNNPSKAINIDPIDFTTVVANARGIKFDGSTLVTVTDTSLYDNIMTLKSGQYIQISDSTVTQNNGEWFVTDVDPAGKFFRVSANLSAKADSDLITIKAKNRFYSELTPVGSSSINKYVTRKIKLANPSTGIKIKFDAQVPPKANIGIYYKINPTGTDTNFNFVEYRTARETVPDTLKSLNPVLLANEVDLVDLPSFDAITVKLVMTSTDSTQIPIIKDLRIIATA